jgi:hypothetical protein
LFYCAYRALIPGDGRGDAEGVDAAVRVLNF